MLVLQHGFFWCFQSALATLSTVVGGGLRRMAIGSVNVVRHGGNGNAGFIDYFIVGEHFKRFVVSGWGGFHGSAQDRASMIWEARFKLRPLSIVLPILAFARRKKIAEINTENRGLFSFLVCWLVSPLILFHHGG
ncbi:hypothetical protein O9929_11385 [Vibrio lentus]|nr:hypothetical protein [Vibrio lentus]